MSFGLNEHRSPHNVGFGYALNGGDEEDRTLDLTDANRTLSQLSYAPKLWKYTILGLALCKIPKAVGLLCG